MTDNWWVPFIMAAGSLLLQGVMAWVVLQFIRVEQDRHRVQLVEHERMLTRHESAIQDHEREIARLRDSRDRSGHR